MYEQKLERVRAIWRSADTEGRGLHPAERGEVERLIGEIEQEKRVRGTLDGNGSGHYERSLEGIGGGGPGELFTNSDGYMKGQGPLVAAAAVEYRHGRGGRHGRGPALQGTLLEGTGAAPGSGGGFIPAPQVIPGVVEKLFQPLTLEALLSSGQATGNTVRYAAEGTATSGAAGVAEGGVKPESTIALGTFDEPVKKIATSIVASDELLEDAAAVQQFVGGRLSLFVQIESERQLLRGAGGNEVQGLLNGRNVPVYAGGTAAGNKAVQVFKAMNGRAARPTSSRSGW